MRLIICGSRDLPEDRESLDAVAGLAASLPSNGLCLDDEVFSGGCRGGDTVGETWAMERDIRIRRFPADWSLGKKAGPLRNQAMVDEADAVVAIMYPDSRGTKDCVKRAIAKGIPVAMLVLPRKAGGG
jgi:hypothetical protein